MFFEKLMLGMTLWCLFNMTAHCLEWELTGRLNINTEGHRSGGHRLVSANSFHQNWVSRRNEMTSSWVNEVPFDRIFNATNSMRNMCGHFRGVQTECVLTGTDIECFLDTVTYDRQAMIYLGYDVRGFKVTSHSVNNHYRQRTTSTPRGTIQIHIFGTVQGSFNFTLGLVKTSSNPSIQQVAILAYQYRVEHGIC